MKELVICFFFIVNAYIYIAFLFGQLLMSKSGAYVKVTSNLGETNFLIAQQLTISLQFKNTDV